MYHQYQILTKRPELIVDRLPKDWGSGYKNVLLGVSIESQKYWYRAETLSDIPAENRFISLEPLLGPVNVLTETNGRRAIDKIHWVILGGESGNENGAFKYRPCEVEWFRDIITDLRREVPHVKIFVKQLGTYLYHKIGLPDRHGGDLNGWPEYLSDLKIREFIPFK